jgi:peptidoglycan/LPS O-acetylase OafA/YrhL
MDVLPPNSQPSVPPAFEQSRKIADIEVLRGIAVLMIVVFHVHGTLLNWPIPWWAHVTDSYFNFWPGVDLFFAISGFVIARSLLPRLQASATPHQFFDAALAFWIRRVWRLLPTAWLWLAIILTCAGLFNASGSFGLFHDNFESVCAALLSLANVHLAEAFGHYGVGASAPYWSLSLEEQFYLALPLLAFAAGKRLPAVLGILCVCVFLIPGDGAWLASFRIQPILLGVLLAFLQRQPLYARLEPAALGRSRVARGVCGLGLLLMLSVMGPRGQHITPYRFDVIAIISAIIVFIASYNRDYICRNGWLKRLIVWVGSRSYAIYVIHTPAFAATNEIFYRLSPAGTVFDQRFTLRFLVVGLGLTVVLADANYRFIETPFRRRGARIAQRLLA